MSATTVAANSTNIPAALPAVESEDEREKLINQFAAGETKPENRDPISETKDEEDDEDEIVEIPKASKKKLFLAFVGFVACFVLLLAALCWFFGIGVFTAAKSQTVDRTRKNDVSAGGAPLTEDEKLKNALNIVAEKNADKTSDTIAAANSVSTSADSSVTIPSEKNADLNGAVVPDLPVTKTNYGAADVSTNTVGGSSSVVPSNSVSNGIENSSGKNQKNPLLIAARSEQNGEITPAGRSLFFGVKQKESNTVAVAPVAANNQATAQNNYAAFNSTETAIPFSTLLPIRFLGAVYTLRASGGIVRMELTRAVAGKNYSYPAGTILVGTLRGSEYKRAYLSVVGLIDPKSGGLVKIEGEVMGGDGASGVVGKRRKVKGAWSRVLGGLREAGRDALGALGNWRSGAGGGTVILSDPTRRASGSITEELSGLTGGRNDSGEFVEIAAGTNAYVLITDLPDEISNSRLAQNQKSATGLSDDELADLFSEGSPEKIRAALPRMTPEFRRLAEQTLAAIEKGE